jgi:cytoskeletal protein CcmA (bactofilin family)
MFDFGFKSEKKASIAAPATTLLGEGTRWIGELQAGCGSLRIDGDMEGTLVSEGTVLVEAGGKVSGTIQARNLLVTGRVDGMIHVVERLEVLRHGWIEGELEMGTLVVDEGGTLQGNCARLTPMGAKEPVPLVPRRDEAAKVEAMPGNSLDAISDPRPSHGRPVAPSGRGRY